MSTRLAVGLWTLALLAAAGAVTLVFTSDHEDDPWATAALVTSLGLAFVASGLVAKVRRPENRTGTLMIAVGFIAFLGALEAADNAYVFTAGLALSTIVYAVYAHLVFAYPSGRLQTRTARWGTVAAYLVVTVIEWAWLLFERDPARPSCDDCPENRLLVSANDGLADAISVVQRLVALAVLALALGLLVRRWRSSMPAARRAITPVLAAIGVSLVLIAAMLVAQSVSEPLTEAIYWVLLVSWTLVPVAFLVGVLRSRLAATGTGRMLLEVRDEASAPELEQAIRRALRDPSARLALLLPGGDSYVDTAGKPYALPAETSPCSVTTIESDGQPLAAIVHDAALRDQPQLLAEVVAAARLALEKTRSVEALRASEERSRALIEAIPDNMFRLRTDGTILDFHLTWEPVGPAPERRAVGMNFAEWNAPGVFDDIAEQARRAVATGDVQRIEYEFDDDGSRMYREARIAASGEDEVVVIVRDIGDLKRREAELEASDKRNRALLGAIPDNMFRIRRDGTYVDFHVHDERDLISPDVIGLKVHDRIPRPLADEIVARAARALDEGSLQTLEYELELRGERRHWEARFFASGPDEVLVIDRDITERKRQETELRELAAEQSALRRVAVAVAREMDPRRIFDVVTEEVGRLLGAQTANLLRYEPDGRRGVVIGQWSEPGAEAIPIGSTIDLDSNTAVVEVFRTRKPARVDSYEGLGGSLAARLREAGVRASVSIPVTVSGRLWGAITIATTSDRTPFPPDTERRMGEFAELVGVALANAEAREQLAASRARIVEAADEERRRLERNLHDGAQQRLVALSLLLRLAEGKARTDPAAATEVLRRAGEELGLALEELRELARGIHPAVLTERGLVPALEALARRSPVPVELDVAAERLPAPVEAAAYYVVSEALANVAKYSGASAATVTVSQADGVARVEVRDDGVGGADPGGGTGLRGLADRVEALSGSLAVESPAGVGTRIRAAIPVR